MALFNLEPMLTTKSFSFSIVRECTRVIETCNLCITWRRVHWTMTAIMINVDCKHLSSIVQIESCYGRCRRLRLSRALRAAWTRQMLTFHSLYKVHPPCSCDIGTEPSLHWYQRELSVEKILTDRDWRKDLCQPNHLSVINFEAISKDCEKFH